MTNEIHRPYHPAAPMSEATEALYKECVAATELLRSPGLDVAARIYLVSIKGDMTAKIWNAARKARAK